ncbi:MAG: type II secretion system F family protein [Armatimonadota bacterium]
MMPLLICTLIFLLVAFIVSILLRPKAEVAPERVDEYLLSSPAPARAAAGESFSDRVLLPFLHALGEMLTGITPAGVLAKIRAKLDMAGNPRNYGVVEYLGTKLLSVVVFIPLGLLVLLRVYSDPPFLAWGAGLLLIAVGIWLPDIVLQRIIEYRQTAIRRSLPNVLDLLVVSVEAGVGFDGAVQKVVEKKTGPLEQELARVLEQVRVGQSRAEALREMGRRTQVTDLISFVAAVTQAETMGISIAKVLRTQANTARERRSQRARESSAKLPVKLLFPLVFFIFPSLFVVILGPGVIRFVELFKVLGK